MHSLVAYGVEFLATLYNFIDRVESGGEQHCIISWIQLYNIV